jgi:predicted amidohydrolase
MAHVVLVQMGAAGHKQANLTRIGELIAEAAAGRPDLIVLPEYCYGVPSRDSAAELGEPIPGPFTDALSALARMHEVNVLAGSFAETAADGRVHNTSLFLDRGGEIAGEYRKTHLMDAMRYRESDLIAPGDRLSVFDTDIGRVGVMVCYDLRFPEVAQLMAQAGAEMILVPSAFPAGSPLPPRTDHWDTLTASAALLNQVYVVAVNQFGAHGAENFFGRSCVVDPWGTRIAQAAGREEIVHARLDLSYQREVRDSLAVYANRRPELYAPLEVAS